MRRRTFVAALLAATALQYVTERVAAGQEAVSDGLLRTHVQRLTAAGLDGRLTGSPGERLAMDYLVSELQRIGAKPLPGLTEYRLPFDFTAGTRDAGSRLTLETAGAPRAFTAPAEVQVLPFSDQATASGTVVFAGYGIVVPEGQPFGYDSYAGLDVKDKIVLVLRYFPEDADRDTRAALARYSDLRYKAMAARQRGARALLVVTGPRSPNAGQLVPVSSDAALSGSGIIAASVNGPLGTALLATKGESLESIQKSLDSGNPHVAGFEIPNLTVTIETRIERERRQAFNVVGYLPASATSILPKPWVALGAHFDHLGRGDNGASLARKEEAGQVHAGADDNASGTAAVLAVGQALAQQARQRHLVLAFWSGEELGLLGSASFVAKPPVPLDQLAAYLNFDMVGRMRDNQLVVQGLGTSAGWGRILERHNIAAGFDLQLHQDPYQPTDITSFNAVGVPVLNFFTGSHTDYHRPTDTAEKINYADLLGIVNFASAIARTITEERATPQFTKVEPTAQGGGRAGLRVFTGTIPDYSKEVEGLLLSDVIGGGPAELAGLRKDDVIVEIAGQTIRNVYDYTYALEVLKIGEPVKVVYLRGGMRRETTLTPTARR
jgi:hypothetical protein